MVPQRIYGEYAAGRTATRQSGDTGSSRYNAAPGTVPSYDTTDPQYGAPTGRSPEQGGGIGRQAGAYQVPNPYEDWMRQMQDQMAAMSAGMGAYAPPAPPRIDEDLEQRALQAALDRISAEYGIRIAEPQNALNSLGGDYQMAMQQNSRLFGDAERQQNSAMAGRGLLRSGVRNTEMQRAFDPIESQRREIQNTMAYGEGVEEKDFGTQALSLQAAIEQLTAAQGNAELERRLEAERSGLSHRLATANPGG